MLLNGSAKMSKQKLCHTLGCLAAPFTEGYAHQTFGEAVSVAPGDMLVGLVVHVYNLSLQGAEAGRLLQV